MSYLTSLGLLPKGSNLNVTLLTGFKVEIFNCFLIAQCIPPDLVLVPVNTKAIAKRSESYTE